MRATLAALVFVSLVASSEARAADVTLTIAPVTPTRWTMRVENKGTLPVRLVADARLLSLEITPAAPAATPASSKPGAKRPAAAKAPRAVRCALPPDMRPSSDGPRGVVLLPNKAFKDSFDPRLYCFSSADSAALAAGATVVAHYGWSARKPVHAARPRSPSAAPSPRLPPFVVAPIPLTETDPKAGPVAPVDPLNEVVAAPIALAPSAAAPMVPTSPPVSPVTAASGDLDLRLEAAVSPRLDGTNADEISANVTVTNVGSRAVTLLLRPLTVGFDITPPGGGTVACPAPGGAPIREFFATIPVKGRASLAVLLGAVCPDHTFDLPGLYEVRPHLDMRRASGASLNLTTFDGEIHGPPSLLRIRAPQGGVVAAPPILE